jgi:glycosyltransferase involved in cell wall biosynthesis
MGRLAGHGTQPLFSIIGAAPPGNEGYAARLHELARQAPLAGRVEFSGHVEDPLAVIADLSILVVASRTPEPFGRTVVEAMGQGVPVVVPAAGGPAEIVDDGETGLHYLPGDAVSLAGAVEHLLDNPALVRSMSERGRQVVEERYRPEFQARTVSEIYSRLIPGEV